MKILDVTSTTGWIHPQGFGDAHDTDGVGIGFSPERHLYVCIYTRTHMYMYVYIYIFIYLFIYCFIFHLFIYLYGFIYVLCICLFMWRCLKFESGRLFVHKGVWIDSLPNLPLSPSLVLNIIVQLVFLFDEVCEKAVMSLRLLGILVGHS